MCLFLGVQANVSHPCLVPLVFIFSLVYLLRVQATSLACTLRLYSFLIIYRVGVHAQFFEVMAITKMQLSAISRWIPATMGHFPAINSQCGDKSGDKS